MNFIYFCQPCFCTLYYTDRFEREIYCRYSRQRALAPELQHVLPSKINIDQHTIDMILLCIHVGKNSTSRSAYNVQNSAFIFFILKKHKIYRLSPMKLSI